MEPQSSTLIVTDQDFQAKVISSTKLVVVEFGAGWCGTCHMISPILDDLAREFGEDICICRLDVDDYPQLRERFGVHDLPTILFFKGGKIVDHIIGALPRKVLRSRLLSHLD